MSKVRGRRKADGKKHAGRHHPGAGDGKRGVKRHRGR